MRIEKEKKTYSSTYHALGVEYIILQLVFLILSDRGPIRGHDDYVIHLFKTISSHSNKHARALDWTLALEHNPWTLLELL